MRKLLFLFAVALHAERGVLTLQVSDTEGRPVTRVVLATKGDGGVGPPTDVAGRTRIQLAAQTKPQAILAINIVKAPRDLVFISPWDNQVRVPPFENDAQNFVLVVVSERGRRDLLANRKALVALISRLNLVAGGDSSALAQSERRSGALRDVALAFGFSPAEVEAAVRAFAQNAADPYERGMSALWSGDLPAAEKQLAEALRVRKEQFARQKREAADAAFFLGQSFYAAGQYAESASVYREALQYRPGDPATMNNLGLALSQAGQYAEAEPLLRSAVAAIEVARGPADPELVYALNNLASLLIVRGDTASAEPLLRRGLEIREAKFGLNDLLTASSLTNLGALLVVRGQEAEAESMLHRARQIFEQTKPLGNGPTLKSAAERAQPMERSGIIAGAALASRPGLATVLLALSRLEVRRGRLPEAQALARRAMEVHAATLPASHPDRAGGPWALAEVARAAKDYPAAEAYLRNALERMERSLGTQHPALAQYCAALGDARAAQGNLPGGREMYARALELRRGAFGPNDAMVREMARKVDKQP